MTDIAAIKGRLEAAIKAMDVLFATGKYPLEVTASLDDIAFLLEQNAELQAKVEALEKVERAAKRAVRWPDVRTCFLPATHCIHCEVQGELREALADLPGGE